VTIRWLCVRHKRAGDDLDVLCCREAFFASCATDNHVWYNLRLAAKSPRWRAAVFDIRSNTPRIFQILARHARQAGRTLVRARVGGSRANTP
jgi:hypothetical protein